MGIFKGGALRLFQSFLYLLAFCCAAIILGIYSYFLAVLADRDRPIFRETKAVEGISGVAVIYTIFAVLLTCCLGGVSFFAFLAIVLDIAFIGGFIALAVLTRDGSRSCSGIVSTPLGTGPDYFRFGFSSNGVQGNEVTYGVQLGTACRMNKACFAVAIVGAIVFLITAIMQVVLVRHHKKEKRFGPGPSNGYTSGSSRRKGLFARKNKNATREAELGTAAGAGTLGVAHPDTRPSHDTAYTGTTVGGATGVHEKVEPTGAHTGYYTQPTGTGAVNPYGYNTAAPVTTTGTATNY
ncbi:uncharacterized protein K489DRAFT_419545 [Dissoconium aciculare CBS 342.82]|uniref:MARVEL domain-containing protein n=1 Tax=Dissoconium aciculare CBS 342.82 TaxID=1314786 RepID=A0A6J3MEH4_9PEZI|nr:uncharacterized protein K489DRAFT_419545 [Dissoconium aciculare CBS 342.82]KAF1826283.1 hypothetical protein K489DRAFT_419545 [Dissoconium aciculare CBS 342.82]